jgi:hypothetical protein
MWILELCEISGCRGCQYKYNYRVVSLKYTDVSEVRTASITSAMMEAVSVM